MANVTIYSTQTCPYCKMTKKYFDEKNVEYKDVDITNDEAAQKEMIDKSGQMAVPVIDVDGEIVVGFDQPKLAKLLNLS